PAALAASDAKRHLVVAADNAEEAALCDSTAVFSAKNLLSVCAHLHQRERLPQAEGPFDATDEPTLDFDLSDVKGQVQAKRALEVAASGGHNLLMYGPPGTGKTMLASRLPGILPPLENRERLDVAA
ncbi:ATP-binding protein, partial [Marinimicrobium sp. UBA4209]